MQQSQPDDNMIPGQTYTFQFSLGNWITMPSTSTIQSDLNSNAPGFVSNDLQVTLADTANPFSNIYNVQFTYNGDGTDVISDVANSIVSSVSQGSSDSLSFTGAYADTSANVNAGGVLSGALNSVTAAVTDTANKLSEQTKKSAQDLLTPVEIAVGLVVIFLVVIIFTSGKAGGFSASETGLNIGGSK